MAAPVESKVKWASALTFIVASVGLVVLDAVVATDLVTALPDGVEPFVLALFPTAASFLGGWKAKHTPRI